MFPKAAVVAGLTLGLVFVATTLTSPASANANAVRVNEVSCTGTDWVELHNPSATPADVSNWVLSDRPDGGTARHQFAIPRGTVIPAGGYLVFEQGTMSNQLLWGISCSNGEEVFLFSSLRPSVAKVDSLLVPPAIGNYSFGHISDSAVGHTIPTRGKANQDARPALTSPATVKCAAAKACKMTLKVSNGGSIALAKAVAGVKLTSGVLTISARKKQVLKLTLRLSNAAGVRTSTLTVNIG